MTRRTLLFAGTVIGQIVYFVAITYAWRAVGWQSNLSHGLGWLTSFLIWVANPCVCAYVASKITWDAGKVLTVNVCILFFSIILVCVWVNQSVWVNARGYYRHIDTLPFANETRAWSQLVNIIEMVVSGIIFIVSYSVVLKWKNAGKLLQ